MANKYYELKSIPDLSLMKYSTLDEGNVEGVLKQHRSFWRQMNRRGLLLREGFQFFVDYDPARTAGKRLRIGLRFDDPNADFLFAQQTIESCPLSPYYTFIPLDPVSDPAAQDMVQHVFPCSAHLIKAERFMDSQDPEDPTQYYIVSEWKMNDHARLFSMLKLMAAAGRKCIYCVSIYSKDYSEVLRTSLAPVLAVLRRKTRIRVNRSNTSVGMAEKDENAVDALDAYLRLLEVLDTTPHFLADIQVMADDPKLAAYILDAAAAEALDKGTHTISIDHTPCSLDTVLEKNFLYGAQENAPEPLLELPQIFFLEELSAFAVFPALYPGEWIDCPKETVPELLDAGVVLGNDPEGHRICFPLRELSKHVFLAGVPGSGKTNGMMHLAAQVHKAGIPFLILEPAKHEYRVLTQAKGMEDVELFSPSAATSFPLHINPFEFPIGMTLAEHIRNLLAVFEGAFELEPPMPFLLDSSVEEVYRDHNWLPAMVNQGRLKYPTLSELYQKLEKKLAETDYNPEIRGNMKSALQVRIGSLLVREMGDVFDVESSTIQPEGWLSRSAVIELEAMGSGPANFLTLLVATLIRETLKVFPYQMEPDGRPRHLLFLEEAHNLIGPSAQKSAGQSGDVKAAATAYIVKMLAEVRALGEGIVIADQLPTAMATEVIKNTSLKIGLRITAMDDRLLLGQTMSADEVQLEKMAIFAKGEALISYEPLLKPFEARLPLFQEKELSAEDAAVLRHLIRNPRYREDILRSLQITAAKRKKKRQSLTGHLQKLQILFAQWQPPDSRPNDTEQKDESAAGQQRKLREAKLLRNGLIAGIETLLLETLAYGKTLSPVLETECSLATEKKLIPGEWKEIRQFCQTLVDKTGQEQNESISLFGEIRNALAQMGEGFAITEKQMESFMIRRECFR